MGNLLPLACFGSCLIFFTFISIKKKLHWQNALLALALMLWLGVKYVLPVYIEISSDTINKIYYLGGFVLFGLLSWKTSSIIYALIGVMLLILFCRTFA